jgi:hypothetical protein
MNGGRKQEIRTETSLSTTLLTTNSTRNALGQKPGLRDEQMATVALGVS